VRELAPAFPSGFQTQISISDLPSIANFRAIFTGGKAAASRRTPNSVIGFGVERVKRRMANAIATNKVDD
jgi:hypothetical protein